MILGGRCEQRLNIFEMIKERLTTNPEFNSVNSYNFGVVTFEVDFCFFTNGTADEQTYSQEKQ